MLSCGAEATGSFHNANIWPALIILSLVIQTPPSPALVSRVTRAASGQEASSERPGYPSVPVTMATCPLCPLPSPVPFSP